MHDGTPAVGSQNGDGDRLSGETLVGRLRRWNQQKQWGYVFSELHSSDLVLCGSEDSDFAEGDFIMFELGPELSVLNARKASHEEIIARQDELSSVYQNFHNRRSKAENLPSGGHQRGGRFAAAGHESAMQMQHQPESSMRPPPPPPSSMPPAQAFAAVTQGLGQAGYHQPVTHQHQAYYGYGDDRNYTMTYTHQGMVSPWMNDGNTNANTTISINEQIPGQLHPGMKILIEAPPLLEEGFDAKRIVACLKRTAQPGPKARTMEVTSAFVSSLGREYGHLLRTTSQAFQQNGGEDQMVMSQTTAHGWGSQEWDWGWQGDQMGHAAAGGYGTGGHAGMGQDYG